MNWTLTKNGMAPAVRALRCGLSPLIVNRKLAYGLTISVIARNLTVSPRLSDKREAGLRSVDPALSSDIPQNPGLYLPIREKLRIWEENHKDDVLPRSIFDIDPASPGAIENSMTRQFNGNTVGDEADEDQDSSPMFGREDLVDFGIQRPFLLRGDLVDIASDGGRRSELAVFVQEFATQSQFYTMSGQWIHRKPRRIKYFVPGFIEADELSELLPYLPAEDVAETDRETLHGFKTALPRHIGAPIVKKMRSFWTEADAVYRGSADKLDNAHKLVADEEKITYASLNELADLLLAGKVEKDHHGKLPDSALYAVYRILIADDQAFRPAYSSSQRTAGLFEISSRNEVKSTTYVSTIVRQYQEGLALKISRQNAPLSSSKLEKFLEKARFRIDQSRKNRKPTNFGVVGPYVSSKNRSQDLADNSNMSWNSAFDVPLLMFFESWAALRSFSLASPLNATGSSLLRLIGRYPEYDLDSSTAWLFLQEIRFLPPWSTRVPYDARLPRLGYRLENKPAYPGYVYEMASKMDQDAMSKDRHDWGDMTVYCIDDPSAHEIDDGVSIETVKDSPHERWIHIHVADPAALIAPESPLGVAASNIIGNIYLPDQVQSMLPPDLIAERLGLAPNRPTLTFSARINADGELLESKITPGFIRNVKFLSPGVVMEALGQSKATVFQTFRVGPYIDTDSSRPNMLSVNDLKESDIRDLRLLDQYSAARAAIHTRKGGITISWPHANTTVQFPVDGEYEKSGPNRKDHSYKFDPTITLRTERFDPTAPQDETGLIVKNLMMVASEVAGNWCNDRNIPIIYRATPRHPDRPDPTEFLRNVLEPSQDKDGRSPLSLRLQYLRLLGGAKSTTTPAPHLALGVDRYTRCTSPLRRYSDLLAHWQIHSALREETRTGQSLIGSTRDDYLSFTKAQVDALIPWLDAKESDIRTFNQDGDRNWVIQLLIRAWHFKEMELPKTWEVFVVQVSVSANAKMVHGVILDLGLSATFDLPSFVKEEDVKLGDTFECEFQELHSYHRRVKMTPLRRMKSVGQDGYNP